MSVEKYSDEEIVEIVKSFKLYMKKVIKNSAIDYARKVKTNKFSEVTYSDLIENKVSLSFFDEDIFFIEKNNDIDIVLENIGANITFTKREKQYLEMILEDYSVEEIKRKLKLTEQNIYTIKNRIKNKMEGKKNG